ncbi:MAG: hypothetical protein IIY92_05395, partial [Lachnospiraceae bacterium]|nr:hypothetical protein [Lachnospiraceae bacterium]
KHSQMIFGIGLKEIRGLSAQRSSRSPSGRSMFVAPSQRKSDRRLPVQARHPPIAFSSLSPLICQFPYFA